MLSSMWRKNALVTFLDSGVGKSHDSELQALSDNNLYGNNLRIDAPKGCGISLDKHIRAPF